MWDGIIGQLGKVIEEAFSEETDERLKNDVIPSDPANLIVDNQETLSHELKKKLLTRHCVDGGENRAVENCMEANALQIKGDEEQISSKNVEITKSGIILDILLNTEDLRKKKSPLNFDVTHPEDEDLLSFDLPSCASNPLLNAMLSPQNGITEENSVRTQEIPCAELHMSIKTRASGTHVPTNEKELPLEEQEKHTSHQEVRNVDDVQTVSRPNKQHEIAMVSIDAPPKKLGKESGAEVPFVPEVKCLEKIIENLEEENKCLTERLRTVQETLKKKSEQLRVAETKIAELEDDNKARKIELFQLTSKCLTTSTENVSKLHDEKNLFEIETKRLSSEFEMTIIDYENRLQRMDIEIADAKKRANDAEWRFSEKEREAVFSLQNVRIDMESLQMQLCQLLREKTDLESTHESLRKENAALKDELKCNCKAMEDKIVYQKAAIKELASKNAHLQAKNQEEVTQLSYALQKVLEYEKEIENLKLRFLTVCSQCSSTVDSSKASFSSGFLDSNGSYSMRAAYQAVSIESAEEDKSRSRLEQEVVRQALVIKDLKNEIKNMQNANNRSVELKRKFSTLVDKATSQN